MVDKAVQDSPEQSTDEARTEDVQTSTPNKPRSQQRRNAASSTGSVTGSTGEQASAVRGSMNIYEIAVLYHPDLEIDLAKAENRVKKIIEDNKGKITKTDNWGKRKLAYPIKKQEFAVYVFYTVEMPAENVAKVEQVFNITDEIIRFLITRPDLKAIAKAEATAAEKAKKAAERGDKEGEDEDAEE